MNIRKVGVFRTFLKIFLLAELEEISRGNLKAEK